MLKNLQQGQNTENETDSPNNCYRKLGKKMWNQRAYMQSVKIYKTFMAIRERHT